MSVLHHGGLDEYLAKVSKRERIDIDPDVLRQAGCIVARAEYNMLKERGYKATMLGGGARGTHHFTEFVGGDVHVTMNWSTTVEMIAAAPRVQNRIDTQAPPTGH